jgi:hypothetical protein
LRQLKTWIGKRMREWSRKIKMTPEQITALSPLRN